ncbi:MAG: hypothetical protein KDJ38_17080 [Gammaproteobacteria bacterium]|nr:hypothetical protein [Gammaproteobacteria bacterium]
MKQPFSRILMWLVRLAFLAALTYAASDLPERKEDQDALQNGLSWLD